MVWFQGRITYNKGFAVADGYLQLPSIEVFLGIFSNHPWAYLWVNELKTKYGYDLSKITCNKKTTIIEFRHTEENENNSYPIFVYGC